MVLLLYIISHFFYKITTLFPNKKTTFYSGSFMTKDKDVSILITLGLITLCILNSAFKVRV